MSGQPHKSQSAKYPTNTTLKAQPLHPPQPAFFPPPEKAGRSKTSTVEPSPTVRYVPVRPQPTTIGMLASAHTTTTSAPEPSGLKEEKKERWFVLRPGRWGILPCWRLRVAVGVGLAAVVVSWCGGVNGEGGRGVKEGGRGEGGGGRGVNG